MNTMEQVVAAGRPMPRRWAWRPAWPGGARSVDVAWATAFIIPYAAVFVAFAIYPVIYGLWLGSDPRLYATLFSSPHYPTVVINTLLLVGIGVNMKLFLAFLLSGFFMIRSRWIKGLLVLFMLPWALPALPAFLSLHWMFIGYGGFMNSALETLFGVEGPIWFNSYSLALGANILAYIWKWMPFWTLVFLAGRMAIPQDVYDAAEVDGATGIQRFAYVTFPLLANLYMVCTLLSTLWTVGDFTTAYFVSSGAPALLTEVLATYGFRMSFDWGYPELGVAAVMSALPILIPVAILLIRRLQATEVQL
ncbi:MAG: carbohydrate ABC transporter permease [Acetobacteraceae bacterium]